jgi:transketolase
MRAAWILKSEYGIETRVVNLHTVKPIDKEAITSAAMDCSVVVTAEEHQVGGMGNRVAAVIQTSEKLLGRPVIMGMIGVQDRFGDTGAPWELIKEFEISAEHIAQKARQLHNLITEKNRPKVKH